MNSVISKSPSYLFKHRHIFYFRLAIPRRFRPRLGKTEFRFSLGTGYLSVARRRATRLALLTKDILKELEVGGKLMPLDDSEIRALVTKWFYDSLEAGEESRRHREKPWDEGDIESHSLACDGFHEDAHTSLVFGGVSKDMARIVDDILADNSLDISKESDEYKRLYREFLKTVKRLMCIEKKRFVGDYSDGETPPLYPDMVKVNPDATEDLNQSILMQDALSEYIREKTLTGVWTAKTQAEATAILDVFYEIIGNIPMAKLGHPMCRDFKDTLTRLPANRKKIAQYRDKTIKEIVSMPGVSPMTIRSVNKHIEKAGSFLDWAKRQGYISENYLSGMRLRGTTRPRDERNPFSVDDLKAIFLSDNYLSCSRDWMFWTPLLALFTGCRIEEICQLRLSDIEEVDGVWAVNINDKEEKKLKTPNSARLVPLHPFLTNEMRFIDHVKRLAKGKHTRLFPTLKKMNGNYSHSVSKWFGLFRVRCGISKDSRKTFHSFRHTFATSLQGKLIDDHILKALMGHAEGGETYGRYGKGYPVSVLLDEGIARLDYQATVPLHSILSSRWA